MNFYETFDNDLQVVTDSLKYLLYQRHENIFERLNFENDDIFQEPLLFSYITQDDNSWLDGIIYGYENTKPKQIQVLSNDQGIVYLPNYGYLHTKLNSSRIELITVDKNIRLQFNNETVAFKFEPLLIMENGIEIIRYQHPLFERIFASGNQKNFAIKIDNVYHPYVDKFHAAYNLISRCNPTFFSALRKNLKKIILFSAKAPNSFADMKMHNAICLNVNSWNTEIFFVDHISHEGAHLNFNTLTYESKNRFFKIPLDTLFSEVTGQSYEHSTLYLRFHGLYTFYEITATLEKVIFNEDISSEKLHEAKGRLIYHLHGYGLAIKTFGNLDIFKEDGLALFNMFKLHQNHLSEKYSSWKHIYIFNEQPYDFNLEIFKKQNFQFFVTT